MADKKKGSLADALSKASATREADRKKFIETDKYLTAKREGKVLGCPPPANADIGVWQKIQQDLGKQRGFLEKGLFGKWRYAKEEKPRKDGPAAKLVTGRIKRKKYPSITM